MNYTKIDAKKILIFASIFVFIIVVIALISGGKKEIQEADKPTETEVIESKQLAEKKEYGGLEISDVKFQIADKMTEVTANVVNNTPDDLKSQYVNIDILDKDGNKITDVGGFIGEIESGGTGKMVGSFLTSEATSNACNIKVTEKK